MSKLVTFIRLLHSEGIKPTVDLVTTRLRQLKKLLYYISLDNVCVGKQDDPDLWYDYHKLRKEYGDFVRRLPDYHISGERSKNIWWCWLQGLENAPDICKACLESVRKYFPDYKIHIITEKNLSEYVTIPSYVMEKYKKGLISPAHFSDILRTMLLVSYGGLWTDSTLYFTGRDESILEEPLFLFSDWNTCRRQVCLIANWFISARKGDPILHTTLDLLLEYWKTHDASIDYYFYNLMFNLAAERYIEEWSKVPTLSHLPPIYLMYELADKYDTKRFNQIKKATDFHKLTYKNLKLAQERKDSFYNYIVGEHSQYQTATRAIPATDL